MDFKELYEVAKDQLSSIIINSENPDIRLEQAEYKEDEDLWEVVVSYLEKNPNKNPMTLSQIFPFERVYKKLKINNDKEVKGFYIYEK